MANVKTGELLSFHEYSPEHSDRSARIEVEAVHTNQYSSSMANPNYTYDEETNQNDNSLPTSQSNHNFWTLEYYQKYFDVQTNEVIERIISSVVPQKVSRDYFDERIRGKPDLYGPIWISMTLIFTIAVSGNIANYLQNANKVIHWRYNFHILSFTASAIFCYVWLVPMGLWAILKWSTAPETQNEMETQQSNSPSMMSLFCLYGYSLSIYIPVAILWTIQVSWLQWLLVLMAAFVSGAVLIFWLLPALRKTKFFLPLAALILIFHFLLATGFMMYFFHVPYTSVQVSSSVASSSLSPLSHLNTHTVS